MRVLILSESIHLYHSPDEGLCASIPDLRLDVGNLNDADGLAFSVFDYDVAIIHISKPAYHTIGYRRNLPKLLRDSQIALQHGRSIICLPQSQDFTSKESRENGMSAYEWLREFG